MTEERAATPPAGLLEGTTVLVTGAGSSVGRAGVTLFAQHGARLVLSDLDLPRAEESAALAPQAVALARQCDLTDAQACADLVQATMAAVGRIDVLCNTAGIDPPTATVAHETSEADWDRILTVNLKGVFLSCRAVLPAMMQQGRGAIVNIASQGALLALPAMAAYGASKAGVLHLTREIAADYARYGIRANCVCPSGLELPSLDRRTLLQDEAQLARRAEAMRKAIPLGRVCTPADVANAMLFLASDLAAFITGVALPVDGGATIALRF